MLFSINKEKIKIPNNQQIPIKHISVERKFQIAQG